MIVYTKLDNAVLVFTDKMLTITISIVFIRMNITVIVKMIVSMMLSGTDTVNHAS